ncbi:DUF1998 domain-containing protein [Streptosporangium sp. NPDC049644]|uniref:DUF1998 domain-containing protein n=1 Tax=Streptosporangium sp. NPDC049644 TaxID=3155507 RepID=UPI00341E34E6
MLRQMAGAAVDARCPSPGCRSRSQSHPLSGTDCTGTLRRRSPAHPYETDILALDFDHLVVPLATNTASRHSLLYAMPEGAAEELELSRDDIGGALYARPGNRIGLVMFDAVPGGAGSVLRIARALDGVVKAAHARVSSYDSDIAPVDSHVKRLNLADGVWADAKGDSRDLAVRDVDVPTVLLKSHLGLVSEPAAMMRAGEESEAIADKLRVPSTEVAARPARRGSGGPARGGSCVRDPPGRYARS